MELATYGLVYVAGVMTVFTPCVFPVIPVYLAYFAGVSRGGRPSFASMAFLFLGLASSFVCYGVAIALAARTIAQYLLLASDRVALYSSLALLWLGLIMITPLKSALPLFSTSRLGRPRGGIVGSFISGFLLALVAAPCAGSYVAGAIVALVSRAAGSPHLLAETIAGMLVFSAGMATPLAALGIAAGKIGWALHGRIARSGLVKRGGELMGALFIAYSACSLALTGGAILLEEFVSLVDEVLGAVSFPLVLYASYVALRAYRCSRARPLGALGIGLALMAARHVLSLLRLQSWALSLAESAGCACVAVSLFPGIQGFALIALEGGRGAELASAIALVLLSMLYGYRCKRKEGILISSYLALSALSRILSGLGNPCPPLDFWSALFHASALLLSPAVERARDSLIEAEAIAIS